MIGLKYSLARLQKLAPNQTLNTQKKSLSSKVNSTTMLSAPKKDYKFVLVGDSAVGKSSLLNRFVDKSFSESLLSTIGVDFKFRKVTIDKEEIKIQVWDTAGQQTFRSIVSAYYSSADAIIIVYDITSYDSFESIRDYWIDQAENNNKNYAKIFLIGNKIDEQSKRQVQNFTIESFVEEHEIADRFEASAKTGQNVEEAFIQICKSLYYDKPIVRNQKPQRQSRKNSNTRQEKNETHHQQRPAYTQGRRESAERNSYEHKANRRNSVNQSDDYEESGSYGNGHENVRQNQYQQQQTVNERKKQAPEKQTVKINKPIGINSKNPNYNKSCCLK